jgi:hypothetical protein
MKEGAGERARALFGRRRRRAKNYRRVEQGDLIKPNIILRLI